MKTVLVLSSYVAASRVGATASAFCLRRLGVETLVLPTTVLGRHPGWGAPGGQALGERHLREMWEAIKKQDIYIDAVMTGYLADDTHVELALDIISDVRQSNPHALIMVDPVMGDHGQLYIPESRAQSIKTKLVHQGDIITPNAWELSYITDHKTDSLNNIRQAVSKLPMQSLVTSVPMGQDIGTLYTASQKKIGRQAALTRHTQFDNIPNGCGDALSATFLAHLLNGSTAHESLAKSVSSLYEILSCADALNLNELPLINKQAALIQAPALDIEIL